MFARYSNLSSLVYDAWEFNDVLGGCYVVLFNGDAGLVRFYQDTVGVYGRCCFSVQVSLGNFFGYFQIRVPDVVFYIGGGQFYLFVGGQVGDYYGYRVNAGGLIAQFGVNGFSDGV